MKNKLFVLLLIGILLAGCSGNMAGNTANSNSTEVQQSEVEEINETVEESTSDEPETEVEEIDPDNDLYLPGLIPAEADLVNAFPNASRYDIEIDIRDPFLLTGSQIVEYTNQEDTPLDYLIFRLFPNSSGGGIEISDLMLDGEPADYELISEDTVMKVPLSEALSPGDEVEISMSYEIDIPVAMGGNFGLFGYFDDILVLDLFYPTIPAYDEDGWYEGPPPTEGDWSYYDVGFYQVSVTAPLDWYIVASGSEIGTEEFEDYKTSNFVLGPARDFYLAASNVYMVKQNVVGSTIVNCYAFPEYESGLDWGLTAASKAIEVFGELLGTYEYAEYDVISSPMQAGGIEYPGATSINIEYFNKDNEVYGMPAFTMLEIVIAHEVAHHWFYNSVGNDQTTEAWLDEGIVQYLTGRYMEAMYGKKGYLDYKASWYDRMERINFAENPIAMENMEFPKGQYVSTVYGRAPLFMDALDGLMGRETFDAFLRDYYQTYRFQVVTTEDFRNLAEEHCQCDLTDLFEEWVYP